jgi:hypothetical protein
MEIENAFWHSFAKFYRLWTFGSGQSNFEIQGIIKKVAELWRISIIRNLFKKLLRLLKKLVLLLSVHCAVACHAIIVTNYHSTWYIYSVVIKVIFNTCLALTFVT